MKLIIDTQFVVKQAVVAAQVCGLLVKAGFNRIFRTQIITTTNVDVRGFTNVCEFEGIPRESPNKPSVMRESPQHLIRAAHEPDELFRL